MSKKEDYKKQKMTLLLTGETIALIRQYGQDKIGSESISAAVRAMAKEYGKSIQATISE
jgi:hypothetical protein